MAHVQIQCVRYDNVVMFARNYDLATPAEYEVVIAEMEREVRDGERTRTVSSDSPLCVKNYEFQSEDEQ